MTALFPYQRHNVEHYETIGISSFTGTPDFAAQHLTALIIIKNIVTVLRSQINRLVR